MSRIKTGVSKKENRENLAILDLCFAWRNQFGIGVRMDQNMAWILSGGKFGIEPERGINGYIVKDDLEATVDTWQVAHYVYKATR